MSGTNNYSGRPVNDAKRVESNFACPKDGTFWRYRLTGHCCACQKAVNVKRSHAAYEANKRWRLANREHFNALGAKYQAQRRTFDIMYPELLRLAKADGCL